MQVTITIKKNSGASEALVFDRPAEMLIGRGRECGIHLANDLQVSRKHAVIHVDPPLAKIRDLKSTNGFYVNDRKIGGAYGEQTESYVNLSAGDTVRCGDSVLSFEIGPRETTAADDSRDIGPPEPLPQVPGYFLKKRLGEGDLGQLYLASTTDPDKLAAVRVMLSNANLSQRIRHVFVREAEGVRALDHPNVAKLLDFGVEDNLAYVASEYADGGNLSQHLKLAPGGKLPYPEAYRLIMQAAEALTFAHARGLVHRGINPHSLLLDGKPEKNLLKIGDLGTARIFEDSGLSWLIPNYAGNSNLGYTPPEQLLDFREARAAADVFSLAAVFYKMLSGHSPYDFGAGMEPVEVVTQGKLIPIEERLAALPIPIAVVIDRSLSPDPDERYRNGGELMEALAMLM